MTDGVDGEAQDHAAGSDATDRMSEKQARANRVNARRSTGPKSSITLAEWSLVDSTDTRAPDQEQLAARKLFAEALEQGNVLDARVGREIQRSIDTYAKLHKRPISGRNTEEDKPLNRETNPFLGPHHPPGTFPKLRDPFSIS